MYDHMTPSLLTCSFALGVVLFEEAVIIHERERGRSRFCFGLVLLFFFITVIGA